MNVLVINSGSSSLKYQLFNMDNGKVLAKGGCERIGAGGTITHKVPGKDDVYYEIDFPTHDEALQEVLLPNLQECGSLSFCNCEVLQEVSLPILMKLMLLVTVLLMVVKNIKHQQKLITT